MRSIRIDADLPRHVERIRGLLDKLRLRCVIETGARFLLDPRRKHQPTLVSRLDDDRKRRLDFLRRAVDIAAELNADAVSFWSGSPDDAATHADYMARLVVECKLLCVDAEAKNVRLAFEPEPGMFIDTMARSSTS